MPLDAKKQRRKSRHVLTIPQARISRPPVPGILTDTVGSGMAALTLMSGNWVASDASRDNGPVPHPLRLSYVCHLTVDVSPAKKVILKVLLKAPISVPLIKVANRGSS